MKDLVALATEQYRLFVFFVTMLKVASHHLLSWCTEAMKAVFLSLTLSCSVLFPFMFLIK